MIKSSTRGRTVVSSCLLSTLLTRRSRPPKYFSRPRHSPAKINSDFCFDACKRTKCTLFPTFLIFREIYDRRRCEHTIPALTDRGNKCEHGELLKMKKTRTVRFSSYWLFARQNRDRSTANFSYIIFPYAPRFVKK